MVRRGIALVTLVSAPGIAEAAIPLYRNGSGLKLDLGIRVQLQYYHLADDGWSEEKLYFRRLRPALEATFSPRWEAELEFDFGDTLEGERMEFKDIFVSYVGLEPKGFVFTFGNEKAVFSRQLQSSSKSLTLVDRGVVGIDDFGSLDRVIGARVDGRDSSKRLTMAASLGLASHEPDASQMEFESPLNAGEIRTGDGPFRAASSSRRSGKSITTRETSAPSNCASRSAPLHIAGRTMEVEIPTPRTVAPFVRTLPTWTGLAVSK